MRRQSFSRRTSSVRSSKVLKVDKTMLDYYTKLSDFHAQFRCIGTNYNQVVKELRIRFSEKKAMALLYKLENYTIDLCEAGAGRLWNFQGRWKLNGNKDRACTIPLNSG